MTIGDTCFFLLCETANGATRLTMAKGVFLSRNFQCSYVSVNTKTIEVKNEHVFRTEKELYCYLFKWFAELYYKD